MKKEIYDKLQLMRKAYREPDFIDTMKYIVAEESIKECASNCSGGSNGN